MQPTPKAVIMYHLNQQGLTQQDLAVRLGMPVGTLARALTASLIKQEGHWPTILEALDLEVVIRPKRPQ